jgi:hypothetical protein
MLNDFATALEAELRRRQVDYDGVTLLRFLRDAWPLLQDDPDPMPWADRFIERTRGADVTPRMTRDPPPPAQDVTGHTG